MFIDHKHKPPSDNCNLLKLEPENVLLAENVLGAINEIPPPVGTQVLFLVHGILSSESSNR